MIELTIGDDVNAFDQNRLTGSAIGISNFIYQHGD